MANSIVVYPNSADATNQPITAADYISVSIRSACLDPNKYPESFLLKNTITFTVAVQAAGKNFSFPLYTDYAAGSAQRLAINQDALLTDIPCNGNTLGISANVFRSDKNDFVPAVIDILSGAKSNPALTTYATAAIPGIQLVGIVAGDLYNTFFPQHGSSIINTTPANLKVGGPGVDNLRDCYMLQYQGADDMNGNQLEVTENEDIVWAGQDENFLRSGSWILFRISGSASRADQPVRPWDILFQKAIGEYSGLPGTDPKNADQEFTNAETLLTNDPDVTQGDKDAIYKRYGDAYNAAKNTHGGGNGAQVANAIAASIKQVVVNGQSIHHVDPVALANRLRTGAVRAAGSSSN